MARPDRLGLGIGALLPMWTSWWWMGDGDELHAQDCHH